MPTLDEIQIRDPFIVADVSSREYLLYGTTGFGEAAHGGFLVRTSRDLVNWSEATTALLREDWPEGATSFWAPEVVEYLGRWYLLGSFMHGTEIVEPDQRYTRIYVAGSPRGPFRPLSSGPITPDGWWSIDGTLHVEADGTPWIVFVREWLQTTDGEMHAMPLTEDLSKADEEPQLLFHASEAAWSRPQTWGKFSGYRVTDGPWLHRTATGELLMLWSSFGATGYATGVAHSASGTIVGPWLQSAQPLFADDGGHAMLFRNFDGELMMALHAPNRPPLERARIFSVKEIEGGLEMKR